MGPTDEIRQLEQHMAENPGSERFVELAQIWISKGDAQQAAQVCETGLGFHPDLPSGHIVYGKALLGLDRLQDAIPAFERACSLNRRDVTLHAQAGLSLAEYAHFEAAIPYLQNGLRIDDSHTLVQALQRELQDHFGVDFERVITGQWMQSDLEPDDPFDNPTEQIDLAAHSLDKMEENGDDPERTEPPTMHFVNPILSNPIVSNLGDDARGNGKREQTQESTMSDVDAGLRAEVFHAVDVLVDKVDSKPPSQFLQAEAEEKVGVEYNREDEEIARPNRDEPPTVLGSEVFSPRPWDVESKAGMEPPTIALDSEAMPTESVSSSGSYESGPMGSDSVSAEFDHPAAPETTINYWKMILVLIPFFVVAVLCGLYFGYRNLRNEKVNSLLEQVHAAIGNDTFAGYTDARQSLLKLLELQEDQSQGTALLAMVESRLHHEYGPNLAYRESAGSLLARLQQQPLDEGESEDLVVYILWARYHRAGKVDDDLKKDLDEALRKYPDKTGLMLLAGRAAWEQGEAESSYKWLLASMSEAPSDVRILAQLAALESATNRRNEATEHLVQVLSINGSHSTLR